MFKQLKENFLNMVNIRLIVLSIIALALGAVMIYRVFADCQRGRLPERLSAENDKSQVISQYQREYL